MKYRRISTLFGCSALVAAAGVWVGRSSNNNGTTPGKDARPGTAEDAGADTGTPDPDSAACGKLPPAGPAQVAIVYTKTLHLGTATGDKADTGAQASDYDNTSQPTIKLAGGKTHVAYVQMQGACSNDGTTCHTGAVLATGTAGTYTSEFAKDANDTTYGGMLEARSFPLGSRSIAPL